MKAELHGKIQDLLARACRAAEAQAAIDKTLPTVSVAQRAFLKRDDDPVVHWCNWAQQPDLRYGCGIATRPAWGQPGEWAHLHPLAKASLAYLDERGDAYVFDHADRVTCPECLAAMKVTP